MYEIAYVLSCLSIADTSLISSVIQVETDSVVVKLTYSDTVSTGTNLIPDIHLIK